MRGDNERAVRNAANESANTPAKVLFAFTPEGRKREAAAVRRGLCVRKQQEELPFNYPSSQGVPPPTRGCAVGLQGEPVPFEERSLFEKANSCTLTA